MRVRFSARTHVGQRREVNQDAFDGGPRGPATLLVVCDGMGGHAAGEVASQLAVTTIMEVYDPSATEPGTSLRDAFTTANQRVYTQGRGTMGTTGVAALFLHNHLFVANVGDSRAYIVREGQISQISNDHSFVSDQVAAGLMTAEQARHSNIRNIITRALGHSVDVNVDIFERELRAGDTVLLSSDGMHGLIEDAEIAEIASIATPDEATQRLVDLANERGGVDNITVVIAQVDELDAADGTSETIALPNAPPAPPAPPSPSPKAEPPLNRLGVLLASLALLLLIGIGAFVVFTASPSANSAPTSAPHITSETRP